MKKLIFVIGLLLICSTAFAYYQNNYQETYPNTTYVTPTGNGGYMATNSYGSQSYYQPTGNGSYMIHSWGDDR